MKIEARCDIEFIFYFTYIIDKGTNKTSPTMLTLQFGQCGNQLGHELFTKITKDIQGRSPGISFSDSYEYIESSSIKWFGGLMKNERNLAQAILIDTERKVIDQVMNQNNKGWSFRTENIITAESTGGSSNNWSFGYSQKGPDFVNPILEVVRKELERADRLDAFLCLMSCAGGTGSGVGSYIIQTLRDTFPTKNIIGTLVFPFRFGEVATQNYNLILSLARIVEDTDMIIILENERLHRESLLANDVGTSKSINENNFPNDMNDIACQKLLSVFQPAADIVDEHTNQINNIISKIVPHPAYKLTTIEAVPLLFDNETSSGSFWQSQKYCEKWQSHSKSLRRKLYVSLTNNHHLKSHRNNINMSESTSNFYNTRSLSNILITRGPIGSKSKNCSQQVGYDNPKLHHDQLNRDDIYATTNWLPISERFTHFHQERRLLNNEKFSSIITNNSRIHKSLDDIITRAWGSYTCGAFLHQYKTHGLEDDDFLRAFAKIEHLNDSYKNL